MGTHKEEAKKGLNIPIMGSLSAQKREGPRKGRLVKREKIPAF